MVEYYSDMLRIHCEARYRPGSRDIGGGRYANLWVARVPDGFIEHLQPLVEARPARTR